MAQADQAQVNTWKMRRDANLIIETAGEVKSTGVRVNNTMDDLCGNSWRSDGAEIFSSAMSGFNKMYQEIEEKLRTVAHLVKGAADEYDRGQEVTIQDAKGMLPRAFDPGSAHTVPVGLVNFK